MRHLIAFIGLFLLIGCGGGASVTVSGKASNLFKAAQTPIEFMAAVLKFEGLRGEDDANPGVIFDAEGDAYQAAIVDLNEEGQPLYEGEIGPEHLGTYTHARITVAAAGQLITFYDETGTSGEKGYAEAFQDFDNSDGAVEELPAGEIQRGDVLVIEEESFHWFEIDASKTYSHSDVRAEVDAYQDATPGDAVQVVELSEPVTIEAAGAYELVIDFDVTDTFSYTDVDSDGQFEPLSDDHDGTANGFTFSIEVPVITVSEAE
jgi:hypothetical protein